MKTLIAKLLCARYNAKLFMCAIYFNPEKKLYMLLFFYITIEEIEAQRH